MRKSIKTNKLLDVLFYFAYILLNIIWFMSNLSFIRHYDYIKLVAIVLLLIVCILQSTKYEKRTFIRIIALISISAISYLYSKDERFLILLLLLLSTKHINIRTVIKVDIVIKILMLLAMPAFLKLGLIKDYFAFFRDGTQRLTLGFIHPNILAFVFTSLVIELYFLIHSKLKVRHFIIYLLLTILMFKSTGSRGSLILFILCTFALFTKDGVKESICNNRIIKRVITNSWVLITILFLLFAYLYSIESPIGISLNNIFTTRIHFIDYFIKKYGVNLLGHNIYLSSSLSYAERIGTAQVILDNTYIYYLIRYGAVSYLIISFFIHLFFKNAYHDKRYTLILMIFFFIIYLSMENRLSTFPLILYLGKYFYNNRLDEREV